MPIIDFTNIIHKLQIKYQPENIETFNIISTGGGVAGIYTSGVFGYLYELIKNNKIKLGKIFGASSGALNASFFLVTIFLLDHPEYLHDYPINNNQAIDYIYRASNKHKDNIRVAIEYAKILSEIFPPNFYKFCNNKLYVFIHIMTWYGPKQIVVNKFYSNEHLINTIVASCSIPYITIPSLYTKYYCYETNKTFYAFDGVNPKLLTDVINKDDKNLCINLMNYYYPVYYRLFPVDDNFEHLYLRGLCDINKLLIHNIPSKVIYFKKSKDESKNKSIYKSSIYKLIFINIVIYSIPSIKKLIFNYSSTK